MVSRGSARAGLCTPVGTMLVVVPLPAFPVGFSTLVLLLGDAIFRLLSFDFSPLQLRGGRFKWGLL